MRLMVVALVVAIGLIVDQLRFSGYYRHTAVGVIERTVRQITGYTF